MVVLLLAMIVTGLNATPTKSCQYDCLKLIDDESSIGYVSPDIYGEPHDWHTGVEGGLLYLGVYEAVGNLINEEWGQLFKNYGFYRWSSWSQNGNPYEFWGDEC